MINRYAAAGAALSSYVCLADKVAAADAAAGARLAAARCATCHSSSDPTHSVVPHLEGQPKAAFVLQWRAFRERRRTAPVMVSLADELSERDVDDIAEHYAALLPPRAAQSSGNNAGRALVDRLRCADCHGSALEGADDGTPRLAGQKPRYIVWSLLQMRGGSRSHGAAAKPDRLLSSLSNSEVEALAEHLATLQ